MKPKVLSFIAGLALLGATAAATYSLVNGASGASAFARSGGSGGRGASSAGNSSSRSSGFHTSAIHTNEGRHRHNRRAGFYSPGFVYPITAPSSVAHYELPVDSNPNSPPPVAAPEMVSHRVNFIEYHMGCLTETVTVPWNDGKDHSVSIVRCLR
jgi:hypothetical protein